LSRDGVLFFPCRKHKKNAYGPIVGRFNRTHLDDGVIWSVTHSYSFGASSVVGTCCSCVFDKHIYISQTSFFKVLGSRYIYPSRYLVGNIRHMQLPKQKKDDNGGWFVPPKPSVGRVASEFGGERTVWWVSEWSSTFRSLFILSCVSSVPCVIVEMMKGLPPHESTIPDRTVGT